MKSQFGLYRTNFGSEPVEALYDYETGRIGPFKCPVKLLFDKAADTVNAIPLYQFYRFMQDERDAIAVWNVNNSGIAVMTRTGLYLRTTDGNSATKSEGMPAWSFTEPISILQGVHVGYIRTIDKTKLIYHYPWYLYYNEEFKRFIDHRFNSCEVKGKPKVNPPLQLYKELLNTSYNAVYIDEETNEPVFLKGDF